MQTSDIFLTLKALLNLPDLIIIAVLLINMIFGFARGLIGSLFGLASRLITLAASFFAAQPDSRHSSVAAARMRAKNRFLR